MKKLAILDTVKNTFLVFDLLKEDEDAIENYLEILVKNKIISSIETIHWQVMPELIIRNYSK